jgi:hypothetical protein
LYAYLSLAKTGGEKLFLNDLVERVSVLENFTENKWRNTDPSLAKTEGEKLMLKDLAERVSVLGGKKLLKIEWSRISTRLTAIRGVSN